jgi:hypothetical protein
LKSNAAQFVERAAGALSILLGEFGPLRADQAGDYADRQGVRAPSLSVRLSKAHTSIASRTILDRSPDGLAQRDRAGGSAPFLFRSRPGHGLCPRDANLRLYLRQCSRFHLQSIVQRNFRIVPCRALAFEFPHSPDEAESLSRQSVHSRYEPSIHVIPQLACVGSSAPLGAVSLRAPRSERG